MHINAYDNEFGTRVDQTVSFRSSNHREIAKDFLVALYTKSKEDFVSEVKAHVFRQHVKSTVDFIIIEYTAVDVMNAIGESQDNDAGEVVTKWRQFTDNYPWSHQANEGISHHHIVYPDDDRKISYLYINLSGVSPLGKGMYEHAMSEWKLLVKERVRAVADHHCQEYISAPLAYLKECCEILDQAISTHNGFYCRMAGLHKVKSRIVRKTDFPLDLDYVLIELTSHQGHHHVR